MKVRRLFAANCMGCNHLKTKAHAISHVGIRYVHGRAHVYIQDEEFNGVY